jgi:hypothetical protein
MPTLLVSDAECIAFLQWRATSWHPCPRWPVFRAVRRRLRRRLQVRRLASLADDRQHHRDEWVEQDAPLPHHDVTCLRRT